MLNNGYNNCFTFYVLKYIIIDLCDGKADLMRCLVSQDPLEIILICWYGAQETLLSMLKTVA